MGLLESLKAQSHLATVSFGSGLAWPALPAPGDGTLRRTRIGGHGIELGILFEGVPLCLQLQRTKRNGGKHSFWGVRFLKKRWETRIGGWLKRGRGKLRPQVGLGGKGIFHQ